MSFCVPPEVGFSNHMARRVTFLSCAFLEGPPCPTLCGRTIGRCLSCLLGLEVHVLLEKKDFPSDVFQSSLYVK